MDFFTQIIAAIYVALGEAAGGPVALCKANQVLRDAIADGAVDDPPQSVSWSRSRDEEDTEETTEFERQPFSFLGAY
ncbi:MAG: hypothetical protein ACM3IH_03025 [Sphingobacteriales bacterium]